MCWMLSLYFNRSSISIVQFTDLHMGEDDHKDLLTLELMGFILSMENPDFVVFTGDQVAGYDVFYYSHRFLLWKQALSITAEFGFIDAGSVSSALENEVIVVLYLGHHTLESGSFFNPYVISAPRMVK